MSRLEKRIVDVAKKIVRRVVRRRRESDSLKLKRKIASFAGRTRGLSVLEAGACDGGDSLEWASLSQIEHVYAFEPVTSVYEALCRTVKGNSKIKTFKTALSNEVSEKEIYISRDADHPGDPAGSSSLLQPTGHLSFHQNIKFDDKEIVHVDTMDRWALANNIDRVDIMWLDMQGAEPKALAGAERILKTTKVIYTEVSLQSMYADTMLYPAFAAYLKSLGFEVKEEFLYWKDMGNVLFVRA
jgi:FkbM family methyltransferase